MRSILNQEAGRPDYITTDGSLPDHELFRRIASGDEPALAVLYNRYQRELLRFLVYRTGDEAAAEELLQDVFVAAWQRAGTFRGSASVKTWLLRVAYYRAATWVSQKRRALVTDELDEQAVLDAPVLDRRMDAAWESEQLAGALALLSENHRTALELVFYHELTYREAAEVVGCPVGTMKSRVSHALAQVNGLLRKAGMDGLK